MGRMLKNRVFKGASNAMGVPNAPSGVTPDAPVNGQTRFNTSSNRLEFYANIAGTPSWNAVAREGNVDIQTNSFTGDSVATTFGPLNAVFQSGDENRVVVHVGTVYQIPVTNYTFNGTANIVFDTAPFNGETITVISGYASTKSTRT